MEQETTSPPSLYTANGDTLGWILNYSMLDGFSLVLRKIQQIGKVKNYPIAVSLAALPLKVFFLIGKMGWTTGGWTQPKNMIEKTLEVNIFC